VEEIVQFGTAGKPVLLYFSSRHIDPNKVDVEQISRLRDFKSKLEKVALIDQFSSPAELELKLTRHLQRQARRLMRSGGERVLVSPAFDAVPRPEKVPGTAGSAPGFSFEDLLAKPALEEPLPDPAPPGDSEGKSRLELLYSEYWNQFNRDLGKSGSRLRHPTVRPKNYVRFPMKSSNIRIYAYVSVRDHYLGIELALDRPYCARLYEKLRSERTRIDTALGGGVEWSENRSSWRIQQHRDSDPADKSGWVAQHTWLRTKVEHYHKVFTEIINRIKDDPPLTR
jgi:hypothetical protein